MVVEVGEGSLRQEFWYRSHWIAPEADLADTDLWGPDLRPHVELEGIEPSTSFMPWGGGQALSGPG